jgi:signal transduction histidine kinase
VRVNFGGGRLQLEVEDHGVGLPQNGAPASHGTGLVAMRERAEILHGRIVFLKAAGERGTLVRLDIPLPEVPAYAD